MQNVNLYTLQNDLEIDFECEVADCEAKLWAFNMFVGMGMNSKKVTVSAMSLGTTCYGVSAGNVTRLLTQPAIKVDTKGPVIVSVATRVKDGTYSVGTAVPILISFDKVYMPHALLPPLCPNGSPPSSLHARHGSGCANFASARPLPVPLQRRSQRPRLRRPQPRAQQRKLRHPQGVRAQASPCLISLRASRPRRFVLANGCNLSMVRHSQVRQPRGQNNDHVLVHDRDGR